MEKVGFAIIGCGIIGKVHAEVIDTIENAELVAVCSASEGSAKALGEKYNCEWVTDYQKILDNPKVQAVAICTPSGMHYEQTIRAARAKKHVLCEKPIDIDVEKARHMTEVCKENGVLFSVIFQRRFDDVTDAVHRAISEGHLGRLLWGSSRSIMYRDTKYYSEPWRGTWDTDGGGVLINQGIHSIDLFLTFFGKVKSVSAKCRTTLHHEIEAEDVGIATVEFANGAIGTIEASTACYPGFSAPISIYGEKGVVLIQGNKLIKYEFQGGKVDYMEDILMSEDKVENASGQKVGNEPHERQFRDVVSAILNGTKPRVTGESATESLELIKAIYKSSDEKREVYIQKH